MKVVITGANGQLGQALQRNVPRQLAGQSLQLMLCTRHGGDGSHALDLADAAACRALVRELKPDWVINAAAYTAVDRAEDEPELARAVNAEAPAAFAEALQATGGRLLQISTDFVFNGEQSHPYQPDQPAAPLGTYGLTKAAGEQRVLDQLGPAGSAHVLRTSWVYGPVGRNFLLTMLRLHDERTEIGVVADQVGCPTSTTSLAEACWQVLERRAAGPALPAILHWSDAGAASWYDFAVAIAELGVDSGLLKRCAVVKPLTTAQYPTPAERPPYSLLDCTASASVLGLEQQHWRHRLAEVIRVLTHNPI